MQEEFKQSDNEKTSVSVEISEADYFDTQKHADAVDALLAEVRAERERGDNLVRPHISVVRALLNILLPIAICAAIFCALYFTLKKHVLTISLCVSLGLLALYVIVRMRAILIWCIKVYQATAPAKVRLGCVFTPTCSEYAIQALNKYGVLRGIPKIISRLRRCHPPNEGNDPLM